MLMQEFITLVTPKVHRQRSLKFECLSQDVRNPPEILKFIFVVARLQFCLAIKY